MTLYCTDTSIRRRRFRKESFREDALRIANDIKGFANKELIEIVWHSIDKVKRPYAEVIGVDLTDISEVAKGIAVRHDIVNARQKDGAERVIAVPDISATIDAVRVLSLRVDMALNPESTPIGIEDAPF